MFSVRARQQETLFSTLAKSCEIFVRKRQEMCKVITMVSPNSKLVTFPTGVADHEPLLKRVLSQSMVELPTIRGKCSPFTSKLAQHSEHIPGTEPKRAMFLSQGDKKSSSEHTCASPLPHALSSVDQAHFQRAASLYALPAAIIGVEETTYLGALLNCPQFPSHYF